MLPCRCSKLENTTKNTTDISTLAATLISDLVIHSCANAGTAAIESALSNKKTILIDREGWDKAIWYQLPESKVVFPEWPSAISKLQEWLNYDEKDKEFGDCSRLLHYFDPYRDGRSHERMSNYLSSLIKNFDRGADLVSAVIDSNDRFCKVWGKDKILSINY